MIEKYRSTCVVLIGDPPFADLSVVPVSSIWFHYTYTPPGGGPPIVATICRDLDAEFFLV